MSGQYFVKAVLSADTLVLLVPNKMPPTEKTVSLAHLNCPRLANKQKASADEPYAWEAREKVRKQLIGQTIEFQHEYSKEDIKREFGRVSFKGTDVAKVLVSEGLAEVRPYQNKKSEYTDSLQKAFDEAKAAKKGKHSDDPSINHIRDITWETEITQAQVNKWKGQTKKAIVEAVLNPRLLKVLIVPSYDQVSLALSGIAQQQQFSAEAKFFIERAILNREVSVLIEGVDKGPANRAPSADILALGSIVNGDKCFQTELVSKGLVTVNNFTIADCQFRQQLRDAEAAAKAARVKYWSTVELKEKSDDPKRPEAVIGGEGFRGTVVQVNSGDTITVAVGGQLRKLQLANTRASKPIFDDEGKDGQRQIAYPRYALEAREFVRSKLIGKEVDIKIEYSRAIPIDDTGDKKEDRTFVSIFIDGKPIQALMAKEGLVSYVRGPPGTDADEMVLAEKEAKEKKKGIWAKELADQTDEKQASKTAFKEKRVGTTILKDLFKPGQKVARQYITFLAKGGSKLRGVVEQVTNPARLRVLIVNQNLIITLALAGLTAPSSGGKKGEDGTIEPAEPFGEEALDFARRNFWQRDVEIEVENHDPNGTFFGSAFINGQNVSCLLLERGYANLNNAAQTTKHAVSLKGAAKTAAEKKVGIWSLDESQRPQPRGLKNRKPKWGAKDELTPSTGAATTATVTNVDDLTWFHAQTKEKQQQLGQVSDYLGQVDTSDSNATKAPLKNGDIVAARFSSDKQLYRAKVLGVKDKTIHVSYFDWGNSEKINRDQVWVSQKIQESFGKISPLASGFGVGFIKPAGDEDVADEASAVVQKLYKGAVTLKPVYTVGDKQYVSVTLSDGTNFEQELVKAGYARLQAQFRAGGSAASQFSEDLKALQQAEEAARRAHKGVWRYGDAVSDDEE